jgi:RNA polymerase sigma-70 factor (ECF subfamily)
VFQNATLRLYRSLADVRPETPAQFFGLAATQIRRSLLDLCRHHFGPQGEAGRHVSDVGIESGDSAAPVGRVTAGIAATEGKPETLECWARFHEAVEQLAADERGVFETVWYGGATYEEAAECLGITKRTVIRRIQRARRFIRDALCDDFPSTE